MSLSHPGQLRIADYTYELPEELIAHFPVAERDMSRLLVYNKGAISEDVYRNIALHLPEDALVVFNQTRVAHVRLLFRKVTGGVIEVFCLEPDSRYADMATAMTQHGGVYWKCLVGGAAKWKKDTTLQLEIPGLGVVLQATFLEQKDGVFLLRLTWDRDDLSFAQVLQSAGKVPLPPYMRRDTEISDKERYQTIYAKEEGSVAAPTAGLHFTEAIMNSFRSKGIQAAYLTLHVGAGTFKQVKSEHISGHDMHPEWIDVTAEFVQQLLGHKGPVVSVGTTSMRTLESLYWIGCRLKKDLATDLSGISVAQWEPYEQDMSISTTEALRALLDYMQARGMQRLVTRTQILIAPGYRPRVVSALVTNFHQPGSTLLLLVAALTGPGWRSIYDYALAQRFRFLSYGDGCLLQW
jgi:S-adenosylmethionine:tRNA ribosyltransferase-isomerase